MTEHEAYSNTSKHLHFSSTLSTRSFELYIITGYKSSIELIELIEKASS